MGLEKILEILKTTDVPAYICIDDGTVSSNEKNVQNCKKVLFRFRRVSKRLRRWETLDAALKRYNAPRPTAVILMVDHFQPLDGSDPFTTTAIKARWKLLNYDEIQALKLAVKSLGLELEMRQSWEVFIPLDVSRLAAFFS